MTTTELQEMVERKSVGRAATKGSSSGRFYPPLEIYRTPDGRVYVRNQGEHGRGDGLWPEEAIEAGMALIQMGTRAKGEA